MNEALDELVFVASSDMIAIFAPTHCVRFTAYHLKKLTGPHSTQLCSKIELNLTEVFPFWDDFLGPK